MSKKNKIPKIIHYCWFGGNPLPELAQKCIESWKKHCPDYEIMRWDESNFDFNYNAYVKEAYEAKKWAFVSDVARLFALVNYGGVYMDTDVEVIKPLEELLEYEAFSGFESETRIPTGLMACTRGHQMFQKFLDDYDDAHFKREDGSLDLTTNVTRITECCLNHGLVLNNTKQTVEGFTLFPNDYLCPKNVETMEVNITENTYTIHHFDGSWHSDEDKYAAQKAKQYGRFLPRSIAGYLAKIQGIVVYRGVKSALRESIGWIRRKKGR